MTSFSCKVQNPSLSHFWPFYSKLIIFTNMQSLLKTHTKYSRKPMSIFWEALRAGKYMDRPKFKWRCRKAEVSLTKLYFELFYWPAQIISPAAGGACGGYGCAGHAWLHPVKGSALGSFFLWWLSTCKKSEILTNSFYSHGQNAWDKLVFVCNSAMRENFNFYFSAVFC